jgi:acyl carrier protein
MAPESVVARVFGLARPLVTDATSNATVEAWDSLSHVTLILALEAEYGVSFSAEDALTMTNVGAIKRVLQTYGASWDS